MRYMIRPGVVSLRICDTDLLVSSRLSLEDVPKVRIIDRHTAALLVLMEKGSTYEEALKLFFRFIHKPEDVIRGRFDNSIGKLMNEGFLISMEDGEQ